MNDLEMQQYLFDLQGYLVIENALNPAEVVAVGAAVPASVRGAVAVVSEAPASSARAAVASAAVSAGTISRMTASPRKCFASTVRPRWSRAVAGSASVQW